MKDEPWGGGRASAALTHPTFPGVASGGGGDCLSPREIQRTGLSLVLKGPDCVLGAPEL